MLPRAPSGNMRSGVAVTYTSRLLYEITFISNGYTFSSAIYPPRPDVPSRLITHWPHFDNPGPLFSMTHDMAHHFVGVWP